MKLYNTLTRKKEEFQPLEEGKVGIYACGPTVYDYIHVGNARPMVVFDTLRRFLEYDGYDVRFIVNFTDIDDKVINKAIKEGLDFSEIANRYIEAYKEDALALNVKEESTIHPRATHYIENIVAFIGGLIEKGSAYESKGDVYFRVASAEDYGKLSKKNIEDLQAGARIEVNTQKENPMDFALWKKSKEGEPHWPSPWGEGRPGWHIECSVMSRELLGDTIDIHAGGSDLQFPHHENEIAQSESLTGKPFANYWLHNGMLTINGSKMSKSEGNFFTVKEIGEEFDLEVLRYFLIASHYRSPINFSREIMEQMEHALERLYNARNNMNYLLDKTRDQASDQDSDHLKALEGFEDKFVQSMRDDINTADAITALFELVKYVNQNFDEATNRELVEKYLDKYNELSGVLGLLYRQDEILEEEILDLIDRRQEARKNKDYQLADEIRDRLLEEDIILEDTQDGVKWRRS